MPTQDKAKYVDTLKQKRSALVAQFKETPSSLTNKHRRWRMAADIEQLQWRVDYLE